MREINPSQDDQSIQRRSCPKRRRAAGWRRFLRRTAKTLVFFVVWLVIFYMWDRPVPAAASDVTFEISFDSAIRAEPYTGRVYLFFSKHPNPPPRFGPNWFHPEPFLSLEVENWKPGEPLTISADRLQQARTFPTDFRDVQVGGMRVQAVARFNPHARDVGSGPGNGYSDVAVIDSSDSGSPVTLKIKHLVDPPKFRESKWCKEFTLRSQLLSDFHQRDVEMKAAVILPQSYYDSPQRRYPVIYNIPGFSGTHYRYQVRQPIEEDNERGVEFIRVQLNPECALGHHVFADSANNGPVGQALTTEMIPQIDRTYRTIAKPAARFLTGHSSGGWSSLWLQVTYPDFFGGTWSTAPDSMDFRDFQRINLYRAGENMYVDPDGERRPIARIGQKPAVWYQDFAEMEWTLDYGGQLYSFEAVFSPRGEDGKPLLLWDRKTGKIDTQVARTWEKYDIRLIIERNWKTLGPQLQGKLHVFMGDADTFYLEGGTLLLKKALEELGSDATVEIFPGKDHSTLMSQTGLPQRIRREMVTAFLAAFPHEGRPQTPKQSDSIKPTR